MVEDGSGEFKLVSPAIDNEGKLPRKYAGDGQGAQKNLSPPLEWYNVPAGTESLALVVQDLDGSEPDGPPNPFGHWVLVNIPATVKGLPEAFSGKEESAGELSGIKEGHNDWKILGWSGPILPEPACSHPHRFEFKLYALDMSPHLGNKVTKDKLLEAIEGHVVGEAVLMAIY